MRERHLDATSAGPRPVPAGAATARDEALGYLLARLPRLQSPDLLARGYPIGSAMRWQRPLLRPSQAS